MTDRNKKTAPGKPFAGFPMEAIFPGIHKERPDIAAADAEAFLAYGHKVDDGSDPLDPAVRARLIDIPPAGFTPFHVDPVPPVLAARIAGLPDDWEKRTETHPAALAITGDATALFRLPPHLGCILLRSKELWVWPA